MCSEDIPLGKGDPVNKQEEQVRLHQLPEAQARLGVGRSTLYNLIADGEIEVVHIGRRALIPSDAIDAFIARQRKATA